MKKDLSLHILPFIIGWYSLIHAVFFAQGIEHYRFSELAFDGIIISAYAAVILVLMKRSDNPAYLLIGSLLLICTLFYGSFRDELFAHPSVNMLIKNYFADKHNTFLIAVIVLLFGAAVRFIITHSKQSNILATYLLVFFCALAGMDLIMLMRDQSSTRLLPPAEPPPLVLRGTKPDVYFLIFDSETSSKSLETYWHYSDDSANRTLSAKGFFLPKEGRSNYNWTPYSIASTINMCYLPDHSAITMDEDFPQNLNPGIFDIFRQNGYAVYNLSFLTFTGYPRLNQFLHYNLWKKTFFYFLYDRLTNYSYKEYSRKQRELLATTYDSLSTLITTGHSGPKFVYAHFYVPHTPAFVDENGKEKNSNSMDAQDMKGYLGQTIYSRKMMIDIVEKIQRASEGKAIIIIHGDHGYRLLEGDEKMNEQFTVYKAIYFPDKNYSLFNDSISSVNTFRVVFNSQFGAKFELLKDSSFNVLMNQLKTFR